MAAGLGFKDFVTGEVLTANDVDGYLMQNIWVFANATARDAAVTSPQEGNACYLKDTDAVMTYSGAAWVLASAPTSYGYAAGKNAIINGAFNVWQRGTSISLTNNTYGYGADRFIAYLSFSAGTSSFSQQTFTPGTAPVAGYEGQYFGRITCGSTSTYLELNQRIEDVRVFAGQTVTFSFWAKSSAAIVITPLFNQNFGSGGSTTVSTSASNITLTSSWVRYTSTIALPSISGKTIGTNAYLNASMTYASGTLNSATIDTWGWQVEASSTATTFQTATGTIQGELAACQRYYYRIGGSAFYETIAFGRASSSTNIQTVFSTPVTLRVSASSVEYSTLIGSVNASATTTVSAVTINQSGKNTIDLTVACSGASFTNGGFGVLQTNNSLSGYLAVSAEL